MPMIFLCLGLTIVCFGILVMRSAMMTDDLMLGFYIAAGGLVMAMMAGAQALINALA